jgi:threonine aldolase
MRQSGILAAAGLYALDHNLSRIGEDHANAKRFAEILSDPSLRSGQAVRPVPPDSNIVMVDLPIDAQPASARLAHAGVLMSAYGPKRIRAVMHLDVSRADVERAARILLDTLR